MTPCRLSAPAVLVLYCVLAPPPPTLAADLQDELNTIYRGSWSVFLLETTSTCDASYTNNQVLGSRVLSSGPHRVPAGELGRVAKVDVKRSRIDILVDIDKPLLVSWADGPYELFDQARCRVELEVKVPREWVKKKLVNEIETLVSRVLERHDDQASVARSERWNRREIEPLPEGYEEVFLEYRAWKAGQLRIELLSTLDEALRVIDRADDDPAYGGGLAAGMEKEADQHRSWGECEEIAGKSFYPVGKDAPSEFEGSDEKDWERGYRDGQVVAFHVELAQRIGVCLGELAVPAVGLAD